MKFENRLRQSLAVANYLYLDLLDRAEDVFQWVPRPSGTLVDVGSQHFYYAQALHAFFQPKALTGVEVEGYRVGQDGHSRVDYARAYIRDVPNTQYQIRDFCDFNEAVDGITCFYPFFEPVALVRWRLPLKVFHPKRLVQAMERALRHQGFVFMVNSGEEEGAIARQLMAETSLKLVGQFTCFDPLTEWKAYPVVGLWRKE